MIIIEEELLANDSLSVLVRKAGVLSRLVLLTLSFLISDAGYNDYNQLDYNQVGVHYQLISILYITLSI